MAVSGVERWKTPEKDRRPAQWLRINQQNDPQMDSETQNQDQLLDLANRLGVLKVGNFRLASGQTSRHYIDGRILNLDAQGSDLVGRIILKKLGPSQSVGGPATGAIAIVAAVLAAAGRQQRPLKGFYWRQTNKDHGRQQQLEGQPLSPVTLVDDTTTTGGSLLQLAKNLEGLGFEIEQIITVFDRGGGDNIQAGGYRYDSLLQLAGDQLVAWSK